MAHFDRVIPPGGEGIIKLTVDTTGYRRKITKGARVTTNDPLAGAVDLRVSAEIVHVIELSPRMVQLRGDGTTALSSKVVIRSEMDTPLVLTPESFTLEDTMTYSVEEVEKGKVFHVTFTTKGPPEEGYRGVLNLKTNYPEKPQLPVTVVVVLRRPRSIEVTPRTLRISGPVGTELKGQVVIRSKSGEPLELTPARFTPPEKMTYAMEETEKGKTFRIHFTTRSANVAESYQGRLDIRTNYPDQPNIRIPVVVIVR